MVKLHVERQWGDMDMETQFMNFSLVEMFACACYVTGSRVTNHHQRLRRLRLSIIYAEVAVLSADAFAWVESSKSVKVLIHSSCVSIICRILRLSLAMM